MKETDDVWLFVFAYIALNQGNTGMVMMIEGGGTEMPATQIETWSLSYSTVQLLD